ncbi:hypothetical protein ACTUM7_08750 [Basfia succiniciproducens]|uniref:hypothetical protein n=1 Tax=Basfia succiniciproducens TaxID=653940 RepID=UPI003FCC97F6
MSVKFDNEGFAVESGYTTVYVVDEQGVFTHSEEQFVSEGGGLPANAVLDAPKPAKQGFAVQRVGNQWQYIEDHRGEVYYDKATKAEAAISELGEIPENLTALKPTCENCEWDGDNWVISAEKQAEVKAQKLQQFIDGIDNKAASIYSIWTRFEQEYTSRENAAKAFKEANYQSEPSRFIADFATKAGIDNKTAADLILVQAEGLRKLLVELANQRMRKYELKKDGLTEDEMQAIYDDIIQQMDNLAEAYQNG